MASVTIHSTSTIVPSHLTPNVVLSLSESDQSMGLEYVQTIYVFKPFEASSLVIDSLRNSLSQVLVPFYPLAGRLRWIGRGRLELDCCAAGAHFIEASSDGKLEDYGDFTPTGAVEQLAPMVDYMNTPVEELPLLWVQVTRFNCGGLSIGLAISHTEADGISAITFINAWASIARGEKTMDTILEPYHDRDFLQLRKPLNLPRFHHQEYNAPPLLIGNSNSEEEEEKEFTAALLKLTKEQVEKLKKRANERNPKPTDGSMDMLVELQPRPYSRFECVSGHIWVTACKARNTGESHQPTVINFAVDIRRRLRSLVPQGFFGNATLVTVTPICEFGDLITKPLSYAAEKIREGTRRCTDEYLKSALNFLASQEDIEWTRSSPSYLGNPNMELTCLTTMPVYEADFGWGKPCYVGPSAIYFDGETFVIPGPEDDNGSLVVVIGLQTRYAEDFKKFFYEDL